MKKLIALIAAILAMLTAAGAVSAADGIDVYLDARKIEFDVEAQIINGRTFVPIRAIFEQMGARVQWDADALTAICTKGDKCVRMTVNEAQMDVNGEIKQMDTCPIVVDGRALAPARYVAEAFGASVEWSEKNNAVVICSENVYAYNDFPDVPDVGKCCGLSLLTEQEVSGNRIFTYSYPWNEEYHSLAYTNSASVLGNYTEEYVEYSQRTVAAYTKDGESEPRYFVGESIDENGTKILEVIIPSGEEPTRTLYAADGRTIEVAESEVGAYLNVGWYETKPEPKRTLYAADGRTIEVAESEVGAYLNVGWYETKAKANSAASSSSQKSYQKSDNRSADGYYYRTPTGKRYHLDPDCGGKNSYRTTNIAGLTPCAKCAK